MELNKDKGPIYSNYDRDRSDNYSAVIDYADRGRSSDELTFMMAHKIMPNQADPAEMRRSSISTQQVQTGMTPLPPFLQALTAAMSQQSAGQSADSQNKVNQAVNQTPYWPGQRRNAVRTEAQRRAAMVGVIIWVLFILLSILGSLFRK